MRFLLDAMLGKLATYLRMCGHDTAYALDRAPDGGHANAPEDDASAGIEDDDELLALARAEGRRIPTTAGSGGARRVASTTGRGATGLTSGSDSGTGERGPSTLRFQEGPSPPGVVWDA
jgi:hypothetical protein